MKNNRIIWISGASTGIGRATSIKFADEGWRVIATSRNIDNLSTLKNEIDNRFGSKKISIFKCDIREKEQVEKTVINIEKNIGEINIALLNAGTTGPHSNEFKVDNYEYVLKTNIIGNLNCINTIYKIFKKRQKGHISIVSSMVGYRGFPIASAYTMSKAALINLAESLYFDFKKAGIRVSVINPGFIKTPLTRKNIFPMPFLKSSEYAAEKIYEGLVKSNKFELIFPPQWFFIMKILRLLPYKIYFFLISRFSGL